MKKVMLLIDVEDNVNLEDIRSEDLVRELKIVINSIYGLKNEGQKNNTPFYGNLKFKNIPDKKYMKEWDIKNEKQASDYLMLKCFYDGYNACVEDLLNE